MTTNSDFDRRAAAYLADGPTELSGRVLDAALREVHQTRQRRRWSAPWRFQQMSSLARLAAVAAVAALAVGGALIGGAGPNPTPSPSSTVAPAPSTACLVAPANQQLLASDCTYALEFLGMQTTIGGTGSFQFSVEPDRIVLQGIDNSSKFGSIEIIAVRSLPATPCADDGTGLPDSAPADVAEYLSWIRESPLGVYPNTDITIGGIQGQRIRMAPSPLPTTSDQEPTCQFPWLAGGEINGLPFFPSGEVTDLNVLSANGAVFLVVAHYAGAEPSDLAGVLKQLDRIRFTP